MKLTAASVYRLFEMERWLLDCSACMNFIRNVLTNGLETNRILDVPLVEDSSLVVTLLISKILSNRCRYLLDFGYFNLAESSLINKVYKFIEIEWRMIYDY